ncbi:hypothetical protein E1218_05160 [Kribbella turkmenica]|uniref:DUF4245 domain-containing protein n=1 Tax=Kribbella turkmenica TaxID=2530375 RepID=A0A4R4XF95_9ACTN|nr:hypothetical protein [Kribbella turkmenica]TDD29122.1 hypothetical protein E1218_05160 [Kribbella turkmenica]
MLTPRHQALLMTLAGMTVGVAVFGSVLAINGNLTGNDTPAGIVNSQSSPSTPSCTDCLQSDSLRYALQAFGTKDDPVSAEVPTGWKSPEDGTRPRFADPSGVWQIRFDTRGSSRSPNEQVDSRARSIDERDLKVISRDNGTLVYTYADQTRGPRMGLSRWISTDHGESTAIEITVGGRPKDEAALRAVLEHATQTLQLPASANDNRPS